MSNLPQIDRLGLLLAEIAELTKQADGIKKELRALGEGSFEGELFRATVSAPGQRETLDMEAVRAKLSVQFITAHTTVTETAPAVRVVARNGKNLKAA